jgi:uncharacterized SAM-binding protein YcdF (DUF218 family)
MGSSEVDPVKVLKGLKNKPLVKPKNKLKPRTFSVFKFIRRTFFLFGVVFLMALGLAFTDYPFFAYANLGMVEVNYEGEPDVIVILGGEGMPSADGLIRCYTAAEKAHLYEGASIAIAIPDHPEDDYALQSWKLMADELMMRGVSMKGLEIEDQATNTHEQAELLFGKIDSNQKLLIITTPEHMTRAVASFKSVGFNYVGGSPAFEQDISAELLTNDHDFLKSPSLALRYNFWSYLQYEVRVAREYTALAYYWVRGWI